LYNTLTRQKEVFTPRPDQVRARAGAQRAQRAVAPLASPADEARARFFRSLCCRRAGQQGQHVRVRRDGVRLQVPCGAAPRLCALASYAAQTHARLTLLAFSRGTRSHIGHARVYVAFDTLFRTLRRHGYDVKCVNAHARLHTHALPLSAAALTGRVHPVWPHRAQLRA
jgi:hypothetical protein